MFVRMGKKNYVKDTVQSRKESAKKNITLNFGGCYITCSIPRDGTNYYVCILYGCRIFA